MKNIVANSLMILWIIICPIISLWANSIKQNDFHTQRILHHYDQKTNFSKGGKLHEVSFDELSIEDTESDHDLFAFPIKYTLTPHYFFIFVYAGLLLLFYLFSKRRLPLCDFLALTICPKYLSKRSLLI